ncbi:MAG: PAS domain S-box protein [Geobacteraceae bacterium]|nr:PAS domain S-box protein [Geobacteraceae bacterium]
MKKLHHLSIRPQMLILIFVMSLSPLGIIIFSSLTTYNFDRHNAYHSAEGLCNEISNQQRIQMAGIEQLLSSFTHIPCVQNRDPECASTFIAELAKRNPEIANILIADLTGHVWASALPLPGRVIVNDRRVFINAISTGQFSSGEFTNGRILKKPLLSFGYPIRNNSGKINDVAIIAFSLESCRNLLKFGKMPENTSLLLTDHCGTILFDSNNSESIGQKDRIDIFRQMSAGPDKGNLADIDKTGTHYSSYQKIRLNNELSPFMYVRSGILKSSLFSDGLIINLLIMVFVTALAILFALYSSKWGIINKILALRDAAQQIGNGNLQIRISDSVAGGELGELACRFEEMSRSLSADLISRQHIMESLHESESNYRMLFETANEGIWGADPEGRTTLVNAQIEKILGYSPEDLLGREISSFIAPEEIESHRAQLALRQLGKSSRYERQFLRKDGTPVILLVSSAPLLDAQGGFKGSLAMVIDITERKQTEEALFESRLLLEKTLASLNEAIFIVETDSRRILNCNITCERMFGYSWAEMIGATTQFLHISEEMSMKFGNEMLRAYADNGCYETVFVMKRKDGTCFDSEHLSTPIKNENGEITKHICVVRDISERMQLQKRLESRKMFVESVFCYLKSGIIVIDHDYRITMLNQYVADYSGELPGVFNGRDLGKVSPELKEALISGLSSGEIPVTLFGKKHFIGFSRFELSISYADQPGYIINFKDLTEILKIRKELRHKERLSAMGEVVASVAHEMRNPLFAMTTVAQIFEMELTLTPAQQELMVSFLKEARRLNNLVSELLDSTRELKIRPKPIDLNQVVIETFRILQSTTDSKRVTLRKHSYAEKIPIIADHEKLKQVMLNIVKNAMEASPEGSFVDLIIEKTVSGVAISVRDAGAGITPEALEKIFDVFYTTKKHGTGLGLSICKNIIEAHNGSLDACNNDDKGATFTISLPFGGEA